MKKLSESYHNLFVLLFILISILIPDIIILPSISGWWSYTTEVKGLVYNVKENRYYVGALLDNYCYTPEQCSERFCSVLSHKNSKGLNTYQSVLITLANRISCSNTTMIWNNIPYGWAYILSAIMISIDLILIIITTIFHFTNYNHTCNNLSDSVSVVTHFSFIMLRLCQIFYFQKIIQSQHALYLGLQILIIGIQVMIILTQKSTVRIFSKCCIKSQ